MQEKICSRCKLVKTIENFHKSNKTKDNLQAFCKLCNKNSTTYERRQAYNERRKLRRQDPEYRQREYDLGKKYRIDYRIKYLLKSVKKRCTDNNLPFNLTELDINIPEFCPVLGVKLTKEEMNIGDWNAPSIDRIIPELGYIKENIMVISKKANTMKNNATKEQLIKFSQFYLNFFK